MALTGHDRSGGSRGGGAHLVILRNLVRAVCRPTTMRPTRVAKSICRSLKSSGVGTREQGVEKVDFFTEAITVYVDHAAAAKERARFI